MTSQMFHIYQVQEDGDSLLVASTYDRQIAEDEVDRINSNLALAGIPTFVSCAFFESETLVGWCNLL